MSRRRQVRAYLAETRPEAERWSAAVQCLLRDVTVTADTGKDVSYPVWRGELACFRCCRAILIIKEAV